MNTDIFRKAEKRLWADSGVTPTERFVRLPHLGTTVRVQEVGEGEPVLFIHGGPNAGSGWAPLAARLPGFRCLILDRPGTGLSDPYPWRRDTIDDFFDHLAIDVLDALGIHRTHLVGSSTGSDFVLIAGAKHPDRVLRSVHLGCPGFAPGMHVPMVMRLFSLPLIWRLAARMPVNEKGLLSQLRLLGHGATVDADRLPPGLVAWFIALYQHTHTMWNESQGTAALVSLGGIRRRYVLTPPQLAAVRSPTRFLWGSEDVFGTPDVGRHMTTLMPEARIEILNDAGHLPWLDDPEGTATATAAHLAQ